MKIITTIPKIIEAREVFFINALEVLNKIEALPDEKYFTYTNQTSKQIALFLKQCFFKEGILTKTVNVVGYKTFFPWSSVIGYSSLNSNTIHINLRKLNSMTIEGYAGHLAHEICHIFGFQHGNNYPSPKKRLSVPYALGYLVSGEMGIEELIDNEYMKNE